MPFNLHMDAASREIIFLLLGSFFLGGIPSGYVIGRLWGVDVRHRGSGNIGATNVARAAGGTAAVLTLILDIVKGTVACLIPVMFHFNSIPGADAIAGATAVMGHCFSPFLLGRGGKGVATTLGVFMYVAPFAAFIGTLIFLLVLGIFRMVSLASLAGIWVPTLLLITGKIGPYSSNVATAAIVIAALVTIRHNSNIRRLRAGVEPRLGPQN